MAINNFNSRVEGFQNPLAWGPELINADSTSVVGEVIDIINFIDTPRFRRILSKTTLSI